MSHHHERQVCRCGAVVMQCRCMAQKTDRVACETCPKCQRATTAALVGVDKISDSPTAAAGVGTENTDPRAVDGGLGIDQRQPFPACARCGQAPHAEPYRPSCPACGTFAPAPLTFAEFSAANRIRCERDFGEPLDESSAYTPAHWALTVTEEVGEIAAAVLGAAGLKKRKAHLTVADIGDETADAVSYLDLLATRLGLDLATILAGKFNRVSERIGSAVRIGDARTDSQDSTPQGTAGAVDTPATAGPEAGR